MTNVEEGVVAKRVLAAYEALLTRSTRMLNHVREQDWDNLVAEECEYVVEVEWVRQRERGLVLEPAQRQRKADLLERILEQDLEIRRCLMERRDELDKLIGVSRRKRDLSRSYDI